jgi:hypothetical protein
MPEPPPVLLRPTRRRRRRSTIPAQTDAFRLALGALATWRVTHLIAEEDGPFDGIVRLRTRVGDTWLGELMDCFYCLSVWVSAPAAAAVARRRRDLPLTWLALSGAACLLEQATRERVPEPPERGVDDGLLWEEAQGRLRKQADAGEPGRPADAAEAW